MKIVGEYGPDDLIRTIIQGYQDPQFTQTTPVLIDARESTANPNSEYIQRTSRQIVGRRPARHIGKWAVVAERKPVRFGVARMRGLTMESMGITVEVFTEWDAALDYLLT